MTPRLFLLVCLAASPSITAFKSTSIQQSVGSSINNNNNFRSNSRGSSYRRGSKPSSKQDVRSILSRLPISIYQESWCTVRLALGNDDDNNNNNESSVVAPTTTISSDTVERRFSAASTEKSEILVGTNDNIEDVVPITNNNQKKAATSTVNERLLSEIQASVDKEKYGNSKQRDYFKDFQSKKTEEERQRSIEEARDLNGVNPLVCIGGAAFAWACAGGLWLLTTYLGVLFASHPLDTDVYFVQRLTQVFRNVVMGLSSLASGFFGVVGIGIFLLGIRVAYGVMTGELDPTPIKKSKSEEIVMPDVWGLMMGKKPNRRGSRGLNGTDDNPFGL